MKEVEKLWTSYESYLFDRAFMECKRRNIDINTFQGKRALVEAIEYYRNKKEI